MKTPIYFRAPVQNALFRILGVGMIAALLAAALFTAQPAAQAAALAPCTNISDGDWGTAANWNCGHVPTSADDVVIDNTAIGVTISANQAVHNLTINNLGVLTFTAPVTLTISGNFDALGIFDPGSEATGGTVVFTPGSQTILTHGYVLDFWNLTKHTVDAGESLSVDPPIASVGGIHILNNLSLLGAAGNHLLLQSTVPGTQWQINPAGPGLPELDYLDVQDSNNVTFDVSESSTLIIVNHGVDLGNNTGWLILGSKIVVTSSANPVLVGKPVTFTATMTPATATGTITFLDNGEDLCDTVTLVSGAATCTTSALTLGSHSITAVYSGDTNFPTDTSPALMQWVGARFFLPIISR